MTLPDGFEDKDKSDVPSKKRDGTGLKIALWAAIALIALLGISAAMYYTEPPPSSTETRMSLEIDALNNPVTRGASQHLRIVAYANDRPVMGAVIKGGVLYAGYPVESFSGATNDNGLYEYEWQVRDNSDTGTYTVAATAFLGGLGAEGRASFEVIQS